VRTVMPHPANHLGIASQQGSERVGVQQEFHS
jgi:hypothetical protein